MQTATRIITIDAGHRVTNHDSKCRNVHGHTYKIEATIQGCLHKSGSSEGMVQDFGFLKHAMEQVISQWCDHAFMCWIADEAVLRAFCPSRLTLDVWIEDLKEILIHSPFAAWDTPQLGKLVVLSFVPTAENLARFWFHGLERFIHENVGEETEVVNLKVWETPNCFAEFRK